MAKASAKSPEEKLRVGWSDDDFVATAETRDRVGGTCGTRGGIFGQTGPLTIHSLICEFFRVTNAVRAAKLRIARAQPVVEKYPNSL